MAEFINGCKNTKQPRDFWNLFKTSSKQSTDNIDIKQFKTYFEDLFNEIKTKRNENFDNFLNITNFTLSDSTLQSMLKLLVTKSRKL